MARAPSQGRILDEATTPDNGLPLPAATASYTRHLRAGNKAPRTIQTYTDSLVKFASYLQAQGMPTTLTGIRREHIEAFLVALQDAGMKPSSVSVHYRSLATFFVWAVAEDEVATSPMAKMKPPIVPDRPVPVLTEADLIRLLHACDGPTFEDRRDNALIRLLADTGLRRAECAGLRVEDINWEHDVVVVVGKGRKPRAASFGRRTAKALDRYLRMRTRHPQVVKDGDQLAALWLSRRGALTDNGLLQVLQRRGEQAGLPGLHPHVLRHTFAHHALAAGMQEGDLMLLAGWSSRSMLDRYGASAKAERARAAHKRFSLGDRL